MHERIYYQPTSIKPAGIQIRPAKIAHEFLPI